MTYTVEWSFLAERQLLGLRSWKSAARVAEAVYRLAEDGTGRLERLADSPDYLLREPPFIVRLSLNRSARAIVVWAVLRER